MKLLIALVATSIGLIILGACNNRPEPAPAPPLPMADPSTTYFPTK